MTEEEYKKILSMLNNTKEDLSDLLKQVMTTNSDLMMQNYDLQEFMEEQGLTADQFHKWKQQKDLRMYH